MFEVIQLIILWRLNASSNIHLTRGRHSALMRHCRWFALNAALLFSKVKCYFYDGYFFCCFQFLPFYFLLSRNKRTTKFIFIHTPCNAHMRSANFFFLLQHDGNYEKEETVYIAIKKTWITGAKEQEEKERFANKRKKGTHKTHALRFFFDVALQFVSVFIDGWR